MPPKKASGPIRARNRQRPQRSNWWVMVPKAPLPNKQLARLKYSSMTTINPGAAGICGVHVFRANDLYDPDYTSVGHQPRGFDQFMTMFAHFTVVASKIKVDFCARNSNVYDQVVGIALKDSATVYTDVYDYTEGRNIVHGICDAGASARHKTLVTKFDAQKFFGVGDVIGMHDYRGNASASPSELAWFHVFCAPIQAQDAANLDINCQLEFVAMFTEPVQPDES